MFCRVQSIGSGCGAGSIGRSDFMSALQQARQLQQLSQLMELLQQLLQAAGRSQCCGNSQSHSSCGSNGGRRDDLRLTGLTANFRLAGGVGPF